MAELLLSETSENILLRAGYACLLAAALMPPYMGNWQKFQDLAAGLKAEAIRVAALEEELRDLKEAVYGSDEDEDAKE